MSVQRQSSTPDEADLESTAELPVLDVVAFEAAAEERLGNTDTWIIPPPMVRVADEAPGAAAAPTPDLRTQLEIDLRTLAANLRDVEERLTRKGERLTEVERALDASRREQAAAEQRAEHLTQELAQARTAQSMAQADAAELQRKLNDRDASSQALRKHDEEIGIQLAGRDRALARAQQDLSETQARATGYLERLQSNEGRRAVLDGILTGLHREVDERDVRIADLEHEIAVRAARARESESDLSDRAQRIARLENEVSTFAAALAQRDERLRQTERAGDELRRNLTCVNETLASRMERIRELEATAARQMTSSCERQSELDHVLAERAQLLSSVASLEASLTEATARGDEHEKTAHQARSKCEELEIALAGQRRRADQLEAELGTVRTQMQEWGSALQAAGAERNEHMARIAAGEARIQDLEARVDDQRDTVRTLQADTNGSVARAKELEGDLHAAEDAIRRLETELRGKSARLDELEKTNQEWYSIVAEARLALGDRDSLIQRLEEEAANSTVLIGNIQQSIRRMDPGTSGPNELLPDGATRLLVRTDGDSEVVHMLGRKTSVGRTPDNDLQIDAKFISRHHAVILAGPAHTIIEDLNSTNGVMVNNRRIARQTLKDGDIVVIGKTAFRFAVRAMGDRR
jgi:chromosome segregation ATPase